MKPLLAAAMAVFLCVPAQAQDCITVDQIALQIQDNGGELLSIMDVHGVGYDQVVLIDNGTQVLVFGMVRGGCLVGRPLAVGPLAEKRDA